MNVGKLLTGELLGLIWAIADFCHALGIILGEQQRKWGFDTAVSVRAGPNLDGLPLLEHPAGAKVVMCSLSG